MSHKTVIFSLYDDFERTFVVKNGIVTPHNITDRLYRISLGYSFLLRVTQKCTRHVYKLSFSPLRSNRQKVWSLHFKVPN